MIKIKWLLIIVALMLVGCKSTPNYDYDRSVNFEKINTYAWVVESKSQDNGDNFYTSDINQKRIVTAIDRELQSKGFRKVAPNEADVMVNYQTVIDTKRERDLTTTHPYYWSFGYGYHHSHLNWHMNLNSAQREYKAGTLIVDFISANKELIWRGAEQSRLSEKSTPLKREQKINEAVQKVLVNFPPQFQ
ncbi:DUF4136 domain-containing protein [Psychrobium sp. 1_MG-2023]|uniref:DUF4136 domain-containing protein n=1 Tax=Psychrobium sp. 1_MG-2023 TaxID=3062624 RepID=UPI000C348357|nr:DUF4136 domain-containing protein [Psychrobium sp. 1_MG-2023]MDP2559790.1 DUF4136 domain-containing protein [Psychrobium sp. 1_MG-2023]PKF59102.1 hypothetical protein CW748_02635 [Alteromonadales bacterium alter-6D02]